MEVVIVKSRMCEAGQILRHAAICQNPYIQHGKWNAVVDSNPLACANLLAEARKLNNAEAFQKWQEHYASCPACQEALRP